MSGNKNLKYLIINQDKFGKEYDCDVNQVFFSSHENEWIRYKMISDNIPYHLLHYFSQYNYDEIFISMRTLIQDMKIKDNKLYYDDLIHLFTFFAVNMKQDDIVFLCYY